MEQIHCKNLSSETVVYCFCTKVKLHCVFSSECVHISGASRPEQRFLGHNVQMSDLTTGQGASAKRGLHSFWDSVFKVDKNDVFNNQFKSGMPTPGLFFQTEVSGLGLGLPGVFYDFRGPGAKNFYANQGAKGAGRSWSVCKVRTERRN